MTAPDPLVLWGLLSPTQRDEMRVALSFGHHLAGNLNRSWLALQKLGLAERSSLLRRWFLTPLGAQVATPPVCFLDMDGVCARVIDRPRFPGESEDDHAARQATAFERIDAAAVARLNRIHAATGCRFVSSSTWREGRTPAAAAAQITAWLRAKAFEGQVVDATPVLPNVHRSDEIQAWLDAQVVPPRAYAILDDWPMHHIAHRAVQTNYDTLLTDADVERAIALLSPPAPARTGRRARGQGAAARAGAVS